MKNKLKAGCQSTQKLSLPRACLVCGKPILGCSFEDCCTASLLCAVHYYAAQDSKFLGGFEGGPPEENVRRERERLAEWKPVVDVWYQRSGLPSQIG